MLLNPRKFLVDHKFIHHFQYNEREEKKKPIKPKITWSLCVKESMQVTDMMYGQEAYLDHCLVLQNLCSTFHTDV